MKSQKLNYFDMKKVDRSISDYCKICKKFITCEKSKSCSCEEFDTDVKLKSDKK